MTQKKTMTSLALALILMAAPGFADSVGVSQCSRADNGVFHPGLLTVEEDGTRTFHPVGENGLTETIIFNERSAFDWVAAQGLFPADTVFNHYVDYVCGMLCEECEPEEEEVEAPETPDQEPTETQ